MMMMMVANVSIALSYRNAVHATRSNDAISFLVFSQCDACRAQMQTTMTRNANDVSVSCVVERASCVDRREVGMVFVSMIWLVLAIENE